MWAAVVVEADPVADPLADDWEIMRHSVSNMEHGGNVGRSVRFLVRDKTSKKYLGIICVAGDFAQLKGRDDAIGWMENTKNKGIPDRLNNTAIGSVLVPTQPMGFDFLGGKLMALMSISRPVADMWERLYGDVLAGATTTSLHASEKEQSQYNGLGKYMKSFGRSRSRMGWSGLDVVQQRKTVGAANSNTQYRFALDEHLER